MKKKLTFFIGGEDVFVRNLIVGLRKDYTIKIFHRGQETEFYQMYHDCDIAWFEWADGLVINATKSPKIPPKTICRLHSYELFTDMPANIDWNKIDNLVFVNPIVRDLTLEKFGIRPDITRVLYNGVDVEKFSIPKDKSYNKKVAYIGFLNYKKGPDLLLHAFYEIWKYDHNMEFHVAGDFQDERIGLYFSSIAPNLPFKIHMDGWVNNISEYLKDKDYIISTSLFESFQYSIAEGMASGVIPLIHHWRGSDHLYPEKYIFDTFDKCVDIIRNFENNNDKDAERLYCRNWIKDRYSLEKQIEEVKKIIES
jgi:glycosyltransferase involved in cell wall biosynthesis